MSDEFETFNEQVESHIEPEVVQDTARDDEAPDPGRGEETGSSGHETQLDEVEVVGDDNDRLRISAEPPEGPRVDRELPTDEAGKILSFLNLTDARDLEGQTVVIWEDESGESHLEFQTPM
jgi:hypothetical protein